MSRIYGTRAQETRALTTPEVAKLVRADLKQAATDPASALRGLTLSVRSDRNGMRIEVDGLADSDINTVRDGRWVPTSRANTVRAAVHAITNVYNWHNDEYHDVRFYVDPVLLTDRHRAFNAQQREARKAKRDGGAR